jgi:hypothetical protein
MAIEVTSQTLFDNDLKALMAFTALAGDATNEAAVLKVDVSALAVNAQGKTCDRVSISRIWALATTLSVQLLWDATTDVLAIQLPAGTHVELDFRDFGGLRNNAGAGVTGDVMLTTTGAAAAAGYTLVLELIKHYA